MQPVFKTLSRTKILFFFIAISAFSIANAQINVLWESRFTSANSNTDTGKEIAIDQSGNVYVTGTSYTDVTNGFDIVTIKYDPLGVQLWSATFNGSGSSLDEARDIAVDKNGDVFVTGFTASTGPNYDYVTIKYNNAGAQQWATTYDGSGNGFDEAYAIAVDTSGNCYITGSADEGAQGSNFVTIKYDNSGAQQWLRSYDGTGSSIDAGTQIKLDDQFDVYVSGHSTGAGTDLDITTIKYDNSGTQQWLSSYNNSPLNSFDIPEALHIDNLNNVYVAGASYGGLATENDYITIKIDNSGAQQWAVRFDGTLNEEDKAFDLLTDLNQNVYVTGRSMSSGSSAENMVTIKYDATGNLVWQDTYDGPSNGYDDAQQMRLGNSGALYITGYSSGTGTNHDYLTLKYDTGTANILWEARFDGPSSNSDQAFAMEIDATENIYVTGGSNGSTTGKDFSTIKWCQLETFAGNDVSICIGDTAQLNATALGATNYSWSPPATLSDNNIANPIATPTTTTTYVVSSTNALGCVDYDTVTVFINTPPLNTILTSDTTVFCLGDSVTLTAADTGTYSWMPGGDTTRSITVFATANYTVQITDSNLCTTSVSKSVTVNNLPTILVGNNINLCDGDSVQLNATGGSIYTWNTQATLTDSTIANPLAFPSVQTDYWVMGEDTNGCIGRDTLSTFVSVSPIAMITHTSPNDTLDIGIPNGGDIQFFSTSSTNALTFFWDFGDSSPTTTDTIPVHTYSSTGVFTVMLIAYNGGCIDTVYATITVINSTVSIEENSLEDIISIYPNPAKSDLTVNFGSLKNEVVKMNIYSSVGRLIKSSSTLSNNQFKIDIRNLANGIYFIQLETNKNSITKPFTVYH